MKKILFAVALLTALCSISFTVMGQEVYNNGGNYVEYDGNVYFRRYQANSWEETALWGDFAFDSAASSELIALNKNGQSKVILEDSGYGKIFVFKDGFGEMRLLLTKVIVEEDGEDFDRLNLIYSVDLQGNNMQEHLSGFPFVLDAQRSLLIVPGYRGSILMHDLSSNETNLLVDAYYVPLYYDSQLGILYCLDNSGWDDALITIMAVDIETGQEEKLFSITQDELAAISLYDYWGWHADIQNIYTTADHLYIYLTYYEGTGHFLGDSILLEINKDGSGFEVVDNPIEVDWFGINKAFVMHGDIPFYVDLPGFYLFPDRSAEKRQILTESDLAQIGLPEGSYFGEDDFAEVVGVEYLNEKVFFTVFTGSRNEGEDIGWRYAYDRGSIYFYKKDLKQDTISLLYSVGDSVDISLSSYLEFLAKLDLEDGNSIELAVKKLEEFAAELPLEEIEKALGFLEEFLGEVADELNYTLLTGQILDKLEALVRDDEGYLQTSILEKLNDPQQRHDDQVVQEFCQLILSNGMHLNMAEGSLFLEVRSGFLADTFMIYLSDDFKKYVALVEKDELEGFLEDAYLTISFASLGERIATWDIFFQEYPEFTKNQQAIECYEWYLWVFLHGVDNSPVFSEPKGELDPEIKAVYLDFIAENVLLPSGQLVAKYYQLLKDEGFKNTKEVQDFLTEHF